jgi:hypothetical protein
MYKTTYVIAAALILLVIARLRHRKWNVIEVHKTMAYTVFGVHRK